MTEQERSVYMLLLMAGREAEAAAYKEKCDMTEMPSAEGASDKLKRGEEGACQHGEQQITDRSGCTAAEFRLCAGLHDLGEKDAAARQGPGQRQGA